jgi:predicted MFS family arabinose efflux permease
LLGPVLGGAARLATPELVFSVVAVLGVVLALTAWMTAAPAPGGGPQSLGALAGALRDHRIALGAWLTTLTALAYGVIDTLAPLRLARLGAGAVAVGAVFLVAAAVEGVVSPISGRVADRRSRLAPVWLSLAAAPLALVAMPWPGTALALGVMVVLLVAALGMLWAPAMALMSDGGERVGLDHGYSAALFSLTWGAGMVVGAWAGGALASIGGDAVPYVVLAVLCLLTLAGPVRSAARAAG